MNEQSVSLYIHVPFCSGKCFYCDFYSVPATRERIDGYLRALSHEADGVRRKHFDHRKPAVETIYVGGGTPTSLTAGDLAALGRIIGKHFTFASDCEFTSEANPESLTADQIQALRDAGLNRLSIGAQTFDETLLRLIGRRHYGRQTLSAVDLALRSGVENLGLDLMYALPGQSIEQVETDLAIAAGLPIRHLSCYEMTREPGTPLHDSYPPAAGPDPEAEDRSAAMFLRIHEILTAAGLEHYEISNYARAGFACQHNARYWRNRDYVGLGPSAAGFIHRRRYKNISDLQCWQQRVLDDGASPVESEETLDDPRFAGETAMLNLRTARGIAAEEFQSQTGFDPFELFREPIAKFSALGLLEVRNRRITLTRRGMVLSSEVLSEFLR